MASIEKAAEFIVHNNLGISPGESVLIITDKKLRKIADYIFNSSKKITESKIIEITLSKVSGEEPFPEISGIMKNYRVIIIVTLNSLTHTNVVKGALSNARIASLPGITSEIMGRAVIADTFKISRNTHKLCNFLNKGKKVRVTSPGGTDIEFVIAGRKSVGDDGFILKKGNLGNLPAGESFIAPLEGSANGKLVIDGSVLNLRVKKPFEVIVKNGYAVEFYGGKHARLLRDTLEAVGNKNAFNIAEFGIGTNIKAIVTGNVLEDEKAYGTCHFAFGKNSSFGGKVDVPVHLDAVILNPTVQVDGKSIIKKGKVL